MTMIRPPLSRSCLVGWCAVALVIAASAPLAGQANAASAPEELKAVDFMLGSWTVEGAFRTPDHVASDRTLWYVTSVGITRFDGESWISYVPGASARADSILDAAVDRPDPYRFTTAREVSRIQDGFLVLIDDGATSGSTVVRFDTEIGQWASTAFHGPSNTVTHAVASTANGIPVFEGNGRDRRGERVFRRRYEVLSADHYRARTDVSFDAGESWILDQIVLEVRRR